jgi:hypothetical protein
MNAEARVHGLGLVDAFAQHGALPIRWRRCASARHPGERLPVCLPASSSGPARRRLGGGLMASSCAAGSPTRDRAGPRSTELPF